MKLEQILKEGYNQNILTISNILCAALATLFFAQSVTFISHYWNENHFIRFVTFNANISDIMFSTYRVLKYFSNITLACNRVFLLYYVSALLWLK